MTDDTDRDWTVSCRLQVQVYGTEADVDAQVKAFLAKLERDIGIVVSARREWMLCGPIEKGKVNG